MSPDVFELVPPGSIVRARPEMSDYLVTSRGGRLILVSLDTYQAYQYDWTYEEVKRYLDRGVWTIERRGKG